MSKTEMISVPREVAEAAWQALDDDGRFEESCPLREALDQPAEQHHSEPMAYLRASDLERLAQKHVQGCAASLEKGPREGFVGIFTHPAPIEHPGEPVGWASQEFIDKLRSGQCNGIMIHDQQHDRFLVSLFAHADPGEVERFKDANRRLSEENVRRRNECNDLRAENEALVCNLRGKHELTGATYQHLVQERDTLRAQLAERDALLRDLEGKTILSWPDKRRISDAISDSTEPSAPVERDERADFESWYVSWFNSTYKPAKPATAESMKASRKGDDYGAGSLGKNGKWSGWQARAALARKA